MTNVLKIALRFFHDYNELVAGVRRRLNFGKWQNIFGVFELRSDHMIFQKSRRRNESPHYDLHLFLLNILWYNKLQYSKFSVVFMWESVLDSY